LIVWAGLCFFLMIIWWRLSKCAVAVPHGAAREVRTSKSTSAHSRATNAVASGQWASGQKNLRGSAKKSLYHAQPAPTVELDSRNCLGAGAGPNWGVKLSHSIRSEWELGLSWRNKQQRQTCDPGRPLRIVKGAGNRQFTPKPQVLSFAQARLMPQIFAPNNRKATSPRPILGSNYFTYGLGDALPIHPAPCRPESNASHA